MCSTPCDDKTGSPRGSATTLRPTSGCKTPPPVLYLSTVRTFDRGKRVRHKTLYTTGIPRSCPPAHRTTRFFRLFMHSRCAQCFPTIMLLVKTLQEFCETLVFTDNTDADILFVYTRMSGQSDTSGMKASVVNRSCKKKKTARTVFEVSFCYNN